MSLPITLNPGAMHLIASWRSQAAQGKAFANAKKGLLLLAFVLLCGPLDAGQTPVRRRTAPAAAAVAPKVKAALNRISADSLRGHLSFIASDLLEGRNTPSRGLDIAAEYIAAQFRRAGLEPAGDDGYFQTADWLVSEKDPSGYKFEITSDNQTINVDSQQFRMDFPRTMAPIADLHKLDLFKIAYDDRAALESFTSAAILGRVILTELPDLRRQPPARAAELAQAEKAFLDKMASLKASLIISVSKSPVGAAGGLVDTQTAQTPAAQTPIIRVFNSDLAKLYEALAPGASSAAVTAHLSVTEARVKVRNVVGLLRGSDPELKDTYVLVTAHYDHLGMKASGEGDRIFNGANDDGSGTVSVIELASALARISPRPKRSLVFMTFFGEEKGLLGSRYYGRHPIFPIDRTVADINLEQVGRTDSTEGPQVSTASVTGFDYSEVGQILQQAGTAMGIKVYKHERNSDAYFGASDNQALADQGVPAHTLCVAYAYPDYHGVGDHWDKIDYNNMEKVDRMVGLAVVMIATNPQPPKWNQSNPRAARYLEAWNKLHSKP